MRNKAINLRTFRKYAPQKHLRHFLVALICTTIVVGSQLQHHVRPTHSKKLLSVQGGCNSQPKYFENNLTLAMIIYTCGMFYAFLAIAVVCDDYFMLTLEKIAEKLNLSEDVAGATFLAAAGSAPELFSNVSDTFSYTNNIGVGTIVGSAMFNILIIIAASAIAAPEPLIINWRPFARDVTFYCLSILLLLLIFLDGKVWWWESILFCLLYAFYIFYMAFNKRILRICYYRGSRRTETNKGRRYSQDPEKSDEALREIVNDPQKNVQKFRAAVTGVRFVNRVKLIHKEAPLRVRTVGSRHSDSGISQISLSENPFDPNSDHSDGCRKFRAAATAVVMISWLMDKKNGKHRKIPSSIDTVKAVESHDQVTCARYQAVNSTELSHSSPASANLDQNNDRKQPTNAFQENEEDEEDKKENSNIEEKNPWYVHYSEKMMMCISKPLILLFKFTIPPCAEEGWENWYMVSFIVSLLWIAAIAYLMVTLATWSGCLLNISPIILGVTILAVGTSTPDALGSILAAREGMGGMACSNAIGSNVFDICIGLGVPWFIQCTIIKPGTYVTVSTNDLTVRIIILFGTVLCLIFLFILTGFRLTKKLGGVLIILYAGYITYSLIDLS